MLKLLESQAGAHADVYVDELNTIAKYSSISTSNKIHREVAAAKIKINKKEIFDARIAVQKDPFNENKISKLRDLEQKVGSTTMVAFLDARLLSVQKGQL